MSISTVALAIGRAELDDGQVVLDDGSTHPLTAQEVALLRYLAERPHEDVSRDELLTDVLGYAPNVVSRAVDDAMKRLRAKVEQVPAEPFHLVGVRGVGYRFVPLAGGPGRLPGRTSVLVLHDREIDLGRLEVRPFQGEAIQLSAQEGQLLEVLARRPGHLVETQDLLREVWGVRDLTRRRVIDKLLYRLRPKLEPDAVEPAVLKTVRGKGVVLDLPAQARPPEALGVTVEAPDDELIGRDEVLQTLRATLPTARLVSLVGPTGCGKSTLARHATAGDANARLVDLAAARHERDVWQAIAAALGVDTEGDASVDDSAKILRALGAHGGARLVVDHCGAVWAEVRGAVERVLAHGTATVLYVGQRPLELRSEHVLELGPLDPAAASKLLRSRAEARGARILPGDEAHLAEIAALLDGLPLAIELAAARVRALGVSGLVEALELSPLDVLANPRATADARHRSLRAALDVAWRDLDEEERAFLARAAVLRAGFGLVAAERVLLGPDWRGRSAFDLVHGLRERSLLRTWRTPAGVRFAPWRVVVDYVTERQDASTSAVHARHLAWLGTLSDGLDRMDEPSPRDLDRLTPEMEDAVQAVKVGATTNPRDAARVLTWLVPLLSRRARTRAGLELCAAVRRELQPADPLALQLAWREALARSAAGEPHVAIEMYGRLADIATEAGDVAIAVAARARRLSGLAQAGRTAESAAEIEALDALTRDGVPPRAERMVHSARGWLAFRRGDHETAWRLLQDALGAARRDGDVWSEAALHHELGGLAHAEGRLAEAEAFCSIAEGIYLANGAEPAVGSVRDTLGLVRQDQGRLVEAEEIYRALLDGARRRGQMVEEARYANRLGSIAGQRGDLAKSAAWFAQVRATAEQIGDVALATAALYNLGETARRGGRAEEALARFDEALRGYLQMERPSHAGIVLATIGRLELDLGRTDDALAHLDTAVPLLRDTRGPTWGALARTALAEAKARGGDGSALVDGERALDELRASWPGEGLARGLVAVGFACVSLGDAEAARRHLSEADAVLVAAGATAGDAGAAAAKLRSALAAS